MAKYYQNICLPQSELSKDIKNTPSGITYDFMFGDFNLSAAIFDTERARLWAGFYKNIFFDACDARVLQKINFIL